MRTAERFLVCGEDISEKSGYELDINFIRHNRRRLVAEWAQVSWDRSAAYQRIGLFTEAIKDIIGAEELSKSEEEKYQPYFERLRELGRERLLALSFHIRTESARRERGLILRYVKRRESIRRRNGEDNPYLNEVREILGFPTIERVIKIVPLADTPLGEAA